MDAQAFTLNAPMNGVIPKGIIISKLRFFNELEGSCSGLDAPALILLIKGRKPPRYARPSPSESGKCRLLAAAYLACSKFSFSATQTSLVSPTQRFSGASPQNKPTSGEVSPIRWGGRLFRLPRLSHFRWGEKCLRCSRCASFALQKSLSIKPRRGGACAIECF